MSPEVWRNVPYDEKSDMWALGVVLYEMAALRHPFEARSERCLSHKVIQGDLDPLPSGFSADITSMVRLLLDKVWPPRLSPAAALPSPPPPFRTNRTRRVPASSSRGIPSPNAVQVGALSAQPLIQPGRCQDPGARPSAAEVLRNPLLLRNCRGAASSRAHAPASSDPLLNTIQVRPR